MSVAGLNVRTLRQQLGMSLRALADAAGIDPATLSRIENNKTNLTEDLAAKIGKVLHVSSGTLFAEAGLLEAAMLHMRKAPVLTALQLLEWNGPESFEEAASQEYLHTGMNIGSRDMFGFRLADDTNAPEFMPGNMLLFDRRRKPSFGELVIAQTKDSRIFIGRYRVSSDATYFELVPHNPLYPIVSSAAQEGALVVRGVLAEQRKYFPPPVTR